MKTGSVIVGLSCIAAIHSPAQEADKVEQYRGMLLKRPENQVLFGRMVDAWLEKGEMSGLKEMLEAQAAAGTAMDWRLLAVFRNFSGDEEGAIKALDEALKQSPDDPQTRLARAKALGAASRFEEALADLEAAAKTPASATEAGTLKGKFLARAGRPADAVKAWKEIITANPSDEGLMEDLIELEIGEGMLDEAVTAATELADQSKDPYQKALRRMRVAEILSQAGKKNEAIAAYKEVFAVSAESSWLEREVLARVNALFSRDDDSAGLSLFYEQLRNAYPRRVVVKKEAARSLMTSGDGDEAVAMFREVLKVMPGDREVRDEFIALLESAGRFKDAADEVTALLATQDKDAALWEKLAGIRNLAGDEAGTREAVDKAVALTPIDEAGRINAASIYDRFKRPDDAEKTLREAVKTHGISGEAGDALASMLANKGKPEEAVKLWTEMAKTADREGMLRIVRSLTANGRAADAYGLLNSRMDAFGADPLILAALCQAAQFSDKADDAIPQSFELVRQAKTTGDLETALRQAVAIVFRSKDPKKWIDELAARENKSTQELCLLAEMQESLGDSIEAERILKSALVGGDPLLAAAQRVRLFEMRGDFDAAIAATREWLALPGGMKTEQVKRLVNLHERSGNNEAAIKETENWKRIAPGDKLAWTKRAELLQEEGKPEEAVAELRRALAKFGAEEEMRSTLANALIEAGMTPEAWRMYYALYDEAESPASKLKWAVALAGVAAREGKEDELISDFKRRGRDNPSSVVPLLALAEMYREWSQPDDEMQVLEEASRRKPDDVSLIHRLADLEEQNGSTEKSEMLLKSAVRMQDTPENRRRLSAFWIRNGDSERGLAELLASRTSAGPRETEKLVLPLMDSGDWEASIRILTDEAPRHPDDWRLAYLLAHALREAGREEDAFNRFATLLQAKGEITGVLPLIGSGQLGWMTGGSKKEIPEFRMFAYLQNITMRNKDQRRMYYGMPQTGVPLPGTLKELQWMALCQALSIIDEKPDNRKERLAMLKAPGLPSVEFVKNVYSSKPEELAEMMSVENADPKLFEWYIETLNSNPYQSRKVDVKILRKGAEICAAANPELAMLMLSRITYEGEDGLVTADVTRMMELIGKMDEDKRRTFLDPLQRIIMSKVTGIDAAVIQKAEDLLLTEAKTTKKNQSATWITSSIALQRMRSGRFDEAVALINEDFQKTKSNDPSARSSMRGGNPIMQMQMQGRMSRDKLQLSAVLSTMVNHTFQSEFANSSSGGMTLSENQKKLLALLGDKPGGYPGQQEIREPISPEGVATIIPKLQDPYLRVFMANAIGNKEATAREIAALEKEMPEDPKALYVAAAYQLSVKEDQAKAYELLTNACKISKADAMRDAMDWQLYQLGVSLAAKPPAGLDLEPARRAALRLRKTMAFDPDSKTRLAADLKKLGLEEEAKRYTSAPKPVFGQRSSAMSYSGFRQPRQQSGVIQQAITSLAGEGKREAAARRALGELRRLKSASAYSGSDYEERKMMELIVALKLEDDIVKIAQPSETAGFKVRREFAVLLTGLKKNDLALPVLRKLVEEKPDDFDVRSSLLLALPKDEQMSYVMKLADGGFDSDKLGSWFNQILERNGDSKFEDFITNAEMFVVFLEKLKPSFDPKLNLSWVSYVAKDVFNNYYFDNIRLKPLRQGRGGTDKFDEAKTKQRDELARRLHAAMLRHPQSCEQGFILMLSHRASLGYTEELLEKTARDAVVMGFRIKPDEDAVNRYGGSRSQLLWMWRTSNGGGSSSGSPEGAMDPVTYLIRRSSEGKASEVLSSSFLEEIAKGDSEMSKSFKTCLGVVEAPGMDAFKDWKEKSSEMSNDSLTELIWISRLSYFRKRADILDAALEYACDVSLGKIGNSSQRGNTGVAEVLALSITDADGIEGKTKAIDRVTRRVLGPPEAWELYGDDDRNQRIYSVQMRIGIYQQFCQAFQNDRDSMVALARYNAEKNIRIGGGSSLRSSSGWKTDGNEVEIAKDWCSSGIFAPGPGPAGPIRSENVHLIENMESLASNLGSDNGKKLGEALLKVEGPDRFWARFLGARLCNKPAEAIAELSKNSKAISKWPDHCREGLALVVAKWFPDAEKNADGTTRKLLADSRKNGNSEYRKQAQEFLKDGFPQDMHPYSLGSSFGGMMRGLIADDTELASSVWLKAIDHFDNLQSGWSSSSNGFSRTASQYAGSELMQALLNGNVPVVKLAAFIARVEKENPGASSGMFDSNSGYYIRQLFDRNTRRDSSELAKDKALATLKPDARPFAASLLKLHRESDKDSRGVVAQLFLISSFYNSVSFSDAGRASLVEWIRKDFSKQNPEFADAARLLIATRADSKRPPEISEDGVKAFTALVGNDSVPVVIRLGMVYSFFYRQSNATWLDQPSSSGALAKLLESTVASRKKWASQESVRCFTGLSKMKSLTAADASRLLAVLKENPPEVGSGSGNEAMKMISQFMVPLALRSGDKEEIASLVKNSGDAFRGDVDFIIQLWQDGHASAAAQLIARPGENHKGMSGLLFSKSNGEGRQIRFTKSIESSLPDWLGSLQDAAQRFRLECLISVAPDAKDAEAPAKKRSDRISDLVKRFPAEAPKARVSRSEILACLANEPDAAKPLADEYAAMVGKQTLGQLISLRDGSNGVPMQMDATYVTEALIRRSMEYSIESDGSTSPALVQFESINPVPNGNQEYAATEMLREVGTWYSGLLLKRMIENPDGKQAELAEGALAIAKVLISKGREESRQSGVALAITSQALAGKGSALGTWVGELPKHLKETFEKLSTGSNLREIMGMMKYPSLAGKEKDGPRRELLAALVGDASMSAIVVKHMTDLSSLMDSGAFTKEDIFSVIDALPEDHPRKSEYLCEKAGIIGWRGGSQEEALKAYDAAQAAAAGDAKKIDYVKCYRAMYLDNRSRLPEALVVAKEIQMDHLAEREKKIAQEILRKEAVKEKKE